MVDKNPHLNYSNKYNNNNGCTDLKYLCMKYFTFVFMRKRFIAK